MVSAITGTPIPNLTNNSLIPELSQDNFAKLVKTSKDHEGLVNGIWNSIFEAYFPTDGGKWIISPEHRVKSRGFVDLYVFRNIFTNDSLDMQCLILFEGKSSGGDTFFDIIGQLRNYVKSMIKPKEYVFLVGAKGHKCRFWKFTKGDFQEDMQMIINNKKEVATIKTTQDPYDLTNPLDQAKIATILQYIYQDQCKNDGRQFLLEDSEEDANKGGNGGGTDPRDVKVKPPQ